MLSARSASICNRWRQTCKVVLFARSLSRPPENQEVSLAELAENPPVSNTEPLFGIAPRKLTNVEDEDFVSGSPHLNMNRPDSESSAVPSSRTPSHQNYFSQAWAAQKHRPLTRVSGRIEEQLPEPDPSVDVPPPQLPGPSAARVSGRIKEQLSEPDPSVDVPPPQLPGPSVDVPPPPPQNWAQSRIWLQAPDLQASTQETFTFVSYNVLASAYAFRHRGLLYTHVPGEILDWKSRRRKLLSELELCSPDIICLQAVDRFKDFQSDLALKGYVGLYKGRTGAAPDGSAIFWRQKRFQLLHEKSLEFISMGMRDNVAQFCVLQSIVPGASKTGGTSKSGIPGQRRCLIVGNINILFNPKRGDIKLGQCRVFLEQAHKLSSSWPGAPLVLGGCFNCTPQSAVYELLAKSELDISGLNRNYLSGQLPETASSAPKSRTEANKTGASSSRVRLGRSEKEESDVNLSDRLQTSLTARFASKMEVHAMEFASSAKEVLKMHSGVSSSTTSNPNNKYESKTEDLVVKNFVSKTIEILESSLNSKRSPKLMAEGGSPANDGVNGVDLSPGIGGVANSEASCTNSRFLSVGRRDTNAQAAHHTQMNSSESVNVSDPYGTGMEVPTEASVACDQLSHGNAAQEGSIPDVVVETGVDTAVPHCAPADLSTQSTMREHRWDLEELKTATGSSDCRVIKHKLNLHSVYPEVQGRMDTRDVKGEPLLTMYHREFRGTVDYIWRSDGLKVVKVLDTVPLKAMLVTRGLPSTVWGSDHVALACELAFRPS